MEVNCKSVKVETNGVLDPKKALGPWLRVGSQLPQSQGCSVPTQDRSQLTQEEPPKHHTPEWSITVPAQGSFTDPKFTVTYAMLPENSLVKKVLYDITNSFIPPSIRAKNSMILDSD